MPYANLYPGTTAQHIDDAFGPDLDREEWLTECDRPALVRQLARELAGVLATAVLDDTIAAGIPTRYQAPFYAEGPTFRAVQAALAETIRAQWTAEEIVHTAVMYDLAPSFPDWLADRELADEERRHPDRAR